jgi:uncharacterized protein
MTTIQPGPYRKPPTLLRHLVRMMLGLLVIALIPLVTLIGCQEKMLYFPRPYGAETTAHWEQMTQGKRIDYKTSQGNQRAFLQGNLKSPRNLWIFCGGNGTLALDWSDWLLEHAPKEDAWLLVDFPGYGDCEGSPTPGRIRESLKTAVPLALADIGRGGEVDPNRLRFFGHSLGAAAGLIGATDYKIQRGVLLAPFTSTMEMGRHVTGMPVGFLVWHRFDNAARIDELSKRGPGRVIILHGTDDEAIPVWMSRKLAERQPGLIRLREIPGGRHNSIPETNADELAEALREAGED